MIDQNDDLFEPRYLLAKTKAFEVWKNLARSNIPVVLNDIVKALAITTKEEDLSLDGFSRMDNEGVCFIMYKRNSAIVRKRFTVAHEIGHILLEHISFGEDTSQHSNKSQEQEANAFARELLVPSKDLKSFMKNKDKTIEDVMSHYKVSNYVASFAITCNKLVNKVKI